MKKRVLRVRDGNLIPMGNNFAYVLGDHPNKTDDVDIGPNNKNGLSVNHGEIMQFNRNGVRVFSAEPILGGISPSQLVQTGMNPNTVFAAQERYKDIHHLRDDGRHAKLGDWFKGLFGKKETVVDDIPGYYGGNIEPAVVTAVLPAKFNGSQATAARYAEGYRFGKKVARKRDETAKNIVNKLLPTDLNNDLDNNALGFTPIIGDVLQGAQGIKDITSGNYLKGAAGLGMLAIPNFIEKSLKNTYKLGKIAVDGGLGKFINTVPSKNIKKLNSLNIDDIRKSVIDYQQFRDLERGATDINPYLITKEIKIRPSSRKESLLNYFAQTESNVGKVMAGAQNRGNEIVLFPGYIDRPIIGHELRHSIQDELSNYYNKNSIGIPGMDTWFEEINASGKSISKKIINPTPITSNILIKNKNKWKQRPDEFDAELEYFRQKFAPNTTYKELIKGKNDPKSRYTNITKGLKQRFNITSEEVDTIMRELYNAGFKLGGVINNKKLGGDWNTKYNNNTPINKDYAVISLQGNPEFDITGMTKYNDYPIKTVDNRKPILDALWAMENPYGQGLNRDGTYSPYGDPNGSDQDVGPGILLSNLPVKNSYTKQELEDYAYSKVLEGRDKIRQSFDEKYGQGEYDKLDDARKYIMDDVRYRAGKLAQSKWPKFYQAVYDNDVEKLLTESRTEFKDSTDRVIGWDNGRVERLAQYFYPDVIVEHKGNKNTYLKVYKKK